MNTSQDVAKLAKVSQATVSRAFRDDCYINPVTKQRVLEAARQLGYFPNYSARSLKNKKSGIIGLLLTDADNIFYATLTKIVERFVNACGYRLMLTYSNEDPKKERECLESFISSRVEGLFYIPVSTQNRELVDILKNSGVAIVQFIRKLYNDLHTVVVDDEMGAYVATKYLIDKGHTNIVITEYGMNEKLPVKTTGYRRAFTESGVTLVERNILDLPFDIDLTSLIAGAIAERSATAIVTCNSLMTIAALKACKQLKINVPADISFIAYDDSEWLSLLDITAITHPMEEIGQRMSEILFESLKISNQTDPINFAIKPYLLLRDSIKNINLK